LSYKAIKCHAILVLVIFSYSQLDLSFSQIYTSEYGKQRLADEEVNGPLELRQGNGIENPSDDESDADRESIGGDDEEGSHYHMEKLRQYQLNRLK